MKSQCHQKEPSLAERAFLRDPEYGFGEILASGLVKNKMKEVESKARFIDFF